MGLFNNMFPQRLSPPEQVASWKNIQGQDAESRKARAVGGNINCLKLDPSNCTGVYQATGKGAAYNTSLYGCACQDHKKRKLPCKHMYHLAYNLGFNINMDYSYFMQRAEDHPGYEDVPEYVMQDFYAFRKAFEIMLSSKIIDIIKRSGGRMPQTELKQELTEPELKFFDYTIIKAQQNKWIRREKENNRVVFYS